MEWLGLRWAGARVPFAAAMVGSFCANAFAHTVGFAVLVGGAVRARLYTRHGATLVMVAQTSLFCAVSFGLGISALAGLALLLSPLPPLAGLQIHPHISHTLGAVLLVLPATYTLVCGLRRAPVQVAGHTFFLPSAGAAAAQVIVGFLDNAATALLIWILLSGTGVSYPMFAGAYVTATVLGVVSSVPGGAGVFEGTILTILAGVARAPLAAAFIAYRLIYYAIPLGMAGVILLRSGVAGDDALRRVKRVWAVVAPVVLALVAFALGAVLILTGIGRIDPARLVFLKSAVPVIVLETSHLLSLIAGLAMMGGALGLQRRRTRSVPVVIVAAAVGASTALLRGLDIGPALSAAVLGMLLFLSRGAFHRTATGRSDRLLSWWLLGLLAVFLGAAAIGLWIYEETPYETRLWADVGYHADPARFLRSMAVLGSALLAAGVWYLSRVGSPRAIPAERAIVQNVRALVEAEPDTTARLALTGDKALLVSDEGDAFIMYGAAGRSLIAMGDPVGDHAAGSALLWRFKELADAADARPVFYHASPRRLTDYLDLGLSLLKLGEEGRVDLTQFNLEGGKRRSLRQTHTKAVRDGLTFDVLAPPQSTSILAELQVISDLWLIEHGGQEKGFSLGRFDPATLRHEPVAVVRHEGQVVGFANIWTGGTVEASIDLMRHRPSEVRGMMDFMFVELIQWAREQGYTWFNLGVAPLTGFADHPLAPLWHKIGAQVALRGGRFYGFTGLRAFKAKFDPVWTPRYLAAPPNGLAAAMLDATRLIGRRPSSRLTKP